MEQEEKIASLRRELEAEKVKLPKVTAARDQLKAQNDALTKARVETKLQNEKQLAALQEKNTRLLEDQHRELSNHALHDQKKAAEIKNMRAEHEAKLVGLDEEMTKLHRLLSKGEGDKDGILSDIAQERASYDSTIRMLNNAIAEKENEIADLEDQKQNILGNAASDIKDLHREKKSLLTDFVSTVGNLQSALKSVQADHKKQKSDLNEMR